MAMLFFSHSAPVPSWRYTPATTGQVSLSSEWRFFVQSCLRLTLKTSESSSTVLRRNVFLPMTTFVLFQLERLYRHLIYKCSLHGFPRKTVHYIKTKGRTNYRKTAEPTNFFRIRLTIPILRPKSSLNKQHVLWAIGKKKMGFHFFKVTRLTRKTVYTTIQVQICSRPVSS